MESARTDERSGVRTILAGASKGHIHIELVLKAIKAWMAGSLLVVLKSNLSNTSWMTRAACCRVRFHPTKRNYGQTLETGGSRAGFGMRQTLVTMRNEKKRAAIAALENIVVIGIG